MHLNEATGMFKKAGFGAGAVGRLDDAAAVLLEP